MITENMDVKSPEVWSMFSHIDQGFQCRLLFAWVWGISTCPISNDETNAFALFKHPRQRSVTGNSNTSGAFAAAAAYLCFGASEERRKGGFIAVWRLLFLLTP